MPKKKDIKNEEKEANSTVCYACGMPATIRSADGTPFCCLACLTKSNK